MTKTTFLIPVPCELPDMLAHSDSATVTKTTSSAYYTTAINVKFRAFPTPKGAPPQHV
jgi:hypothetical protein